MELQKTNYKNNELNVDKKNEIWFRGKEIASILEYTNTRKAIRDHVHEDDKKLMDFKMKPKSGGTFRSPVMRALKRPSNVSS